MLIQIPVTIVFDCESTHPVNRSGRGHARIFTLRYDTVDTAAPASYTTSYPPAANALWTEDRDGLLLDMMRSDMEAAIKAKATRHPTDYCSDTAEGERLQAALDAPTAPIDWRNAAEASRALDAGLLPEGVSVTADGTLVVPDTPGAVQCRWLLGARYDEIVTTSGKVVKSRDVERLS
jgi:hypothetical protein